MTMIWMILAAWLVPAIASYLLVSIYSKEWYVEDKDLVTLIPGVNIIVLGLVLIILLDEYIINRRIENDCEDYDED